MKKKFAENIQPYVRVTFITKAAGSRVADMIRSQSGQLLAKNTAGSNATT